MPSLPLENLKDPFAIARFVGTCVVGLTIDLWTKHWSFATLAAGRIFKDPTTGRVSINSDVYEFIPGWLHFETTANQGAVFGIGQGQIKFFLIVSFLAIMLLTWMFATAGRHRFSQIVLGMLLAGVLGNMYDRITVGYVRDMIHALPHRYWPGTQTPIFPWIFNVADIMLCVGVPLTLLLGMYQKKDTKPDSADDADTPRVSPKSR